MSLFGALSTAVSGLGSQAVAFGDISDNVANSQTTGYKRVDTAFIDYLTTSTAAQNDPGSVAARPEYANTVQGTITQNDNPLALAIAGQGFFPVSRADGANAGQFSPQKFFTRAGDFHLDKSGYLVNSAGEYLNGWSVATNGAVNRNAIAPILVNSAADQPVPTSRVALSANLPPGGGATPTVPIVSNVSVYDAQGQAHQLALTFTSTGASTWSLAVADDQGNAIGSSDLVFAADGTLGSVTQGAPPTTTTSGAAGVSLATAYPAKGGGTQSITLAMGTIGQTNGLTQFAGAYNLRDLSQDGVPPGAFSSITTTGAGDIVANYDNGQSRTIARVPIVTFDNANALQRQDGSSFTATIASGDPLAHDPGASGSGNIVTNAVEASNVDISSEFTKLITAQRAYSANAKLITTADDMLQQTIDMKR